MKKSKIVYNKSPFRFFERTINIDNEEKSYWIKLLSKALFKLNLNKAFSAFVKKSFVKFINFSTLLLK